MSDRAAPAAAPLPLRGLRVLECAGTVGGAYAGRLLAGMWSKSRALRMTAAALLAVGAILPTIVEWTDFQ